VALASAGGQHALVDSPAVIVHAHAQLAAAVMQPHLDAIGLGVAVGVGFAGDHGLFETGS
jgi:hypothetical protein